MGRKLFFKVLYSIGVPAYLRWRMCHKQKVSVLLFHRITSQHDQLWPAMHLNNFEKLIAQLAKTCQIISFSELEVLKNYPTKPLIILSFDDGYEDFYFDVMPLLVKYGLKSNHNICPGLIDTKMLPWTQILSLYLSYGNSSNSVFEDTFKAYIKNPLKEKHFLKICRILLTYTEQDREALILPLAEHIPAHKMYKLMNWEQIKYIIKQGVEIGSHGYMHRNLMQLNDNLSLQKEIIESKTKIAQETGYDPQIFAFANAQGNALSKAAVRQAGYKYALTGMDKTLTWEALKGKTGIEVSRINISRNDWYEEYLRALGFHSKIKSLLGK